MLIQRSPAQGGFTFFELIVVLAIASMLGYFTLPYLTALSGVFNRSNARAYLFQDIKRAQAETITQGCRGIIQIESDGRSYVYGCDYLSYDEDSSPAPDTNFFRRYLPDNITIQATAPIIFNSRGQAVDTSFIVSNVDITLTETVGGSAEVFVDGTLTGTGVFSY